MARSLLFVLLAVCSLQAQQTTYSKPTSPHPGSLAPAQPACLWLTQGSAARFLGSDVSLKLSSPEAPKRFCRFVQQPSQDSLEIVVSKGALASCPAGSTALRGIGNQAAKCKGPGAHAEMVSGRVREFFFTVTHRSLTRKTIDAQDDALEQIAEQVAGNLF